MNEQMASADFDQVGQQTVTAIGEVLGEPTMGNIFSEARQVGDAIVITAGAWERAGGFGFGGGEGRSSDGETGSGAGAGGGGAAQGRPVAVIRVTPTGVEVTPVIDFTKIGVTVLLAGVGVWRALRRP